MFFTNDIFRELNKIKQEMDDLYTRGNGYCNSRSYPLFNAYDNGDDVVVTAELPGVDKSALDIQYVDDTLTVKGNRKKLEPAAHVQLLRQERTCGDFEKSIKMPFKIDANKINAKLENGILEITLSKAEEAKPKTIQITAQ